MRAPTGAPDVLDICPIPPELQRFTHRRLLVLVYFHSSQHCSSPRQRMMIKSNIIQFIAVIKEGKRNAKSKARARTSTQTVPKTNTCDLPVPMGM